jgi:hypothetical protein
MVRRNRKRKVETAALPAPFTGFMVFAVVCGLVYVWLDCRCEAVGRRLKQAESRRTELNKTLMNEENNWVQARSPANIERSLARYGMKMSWPRPEQIVRIRDDAAPSRLFENPAAVASYRAAPARAHP